MAAKCEMFINCSKNVAGIYPKKRTNMTARHGVLEIIDVKDQIGVTTVKYLRL